MTKDNIIYRFMQNVSDYPEKVEGTIPTIEEIEARLGGILQGGAAAKKGGKA